MAASGYPLVNEQSDPENHLYVVETLVLEGKIGDYQWYSGFYKGRKFRSLRSQTSDSLDRLKAEMGRVREEKRRKEKRQEEKRRKNARRSKKG